MPADGKAGPDGTAQQPPPPPPADGDRPKIEARAGGNAYTSFGTQTNIAGDQHNYPAPVPAPERVSCSLPRDTAAFTGRSTELDSITDAVRQADIGGIHAIVGMPGIGKTALAVHAAHQLADRFPDGQLFLDLHAHTPGQQPTDTFRALAMLLLADGLSVSSLPAHLEERATLWRDRTADKKLLLILDNAASSSQVSPLLPGNPACLIMITARRHLGDLPGQTRSLPLDDLSPREARNMFDRSAERTVDDSDDIETLTKLCGYLPMAITIVARVYNQHPRWSMADLICETETRILRLTAENNTVAAAFDLSVHYLTDQRRRFLTLLALHPGTSIDPYAAAALTATSLQDATNHLDALWSDNLLTETAYRRYGMHDLIRAYTRELATGLSDTERDQALDRLLDYYQHAATRAATVLSQIPWTGPALPALDSTVPPVEQYPKALTWIRTERPNLHACLDHVTDTATQRVRIIAFTTALAQILRTDGPWLDAIHLHTIAAQTAETADQLGRANTLHDLGTVRRLTDDFLEADKLLRQALKLYERLGNRLGRANTLHGLAGVRLQEGKGFPAAVDLLRRALKLYKRLGDQLGQANTLYELGAVRRAQGNFTAAASRLEQALKLYERLGDQRGQVKALYDLGALRYRADDYPQAVEMLQQALNFSTCLGDRLGQAHALYALGAVRRRTGHLEDAANKQTEARALFAHLGSERGEAYTLLELGIVRREEGNYQEAHELLRQLLPIYERLGNQHGQANTLYELGKVRRMEGNFQAAANCLEKALNIIDTSEESQSDRPQVLEEYETVRRLLEDESAAW
ncbi:tetratricopeptide repeat protein [Micromonospora sp. CA-249363]|uniref:tetratricopeptide repeat protein n=1 Tax=Micromonospora sp. CA-249363 TaxID=3239963 RepID=UPI003D8F6A11